MKKQKIPVIASINKINPEIDLKEITKLILTIIPAEKLICFGSTTININNVSCFEREDNIQVPKAKNSYYILLVPALTEKRPAVTIQQKVEQDLKKIADVTIIVHRMDEINLALQNGSSFFTAIYKQGNLLHDGQNETFFPPSAGLEISKRIIGKEAFWARWSGLSNDFLIGARFYAEQKKNNLAIFMLHQALQHCCSGMLRVLTGYRSNSNGLRRLVKLMENILPGFTFSSMNKSPEDVRLMELLLKGFGDARYNVNFEARNEEVTTLINKISKLLQDANLACTNRISHIKLGTIPYQL